MEDLPPIRLRYACLNDLPALGRLADLATRVLCARDYTAAQIDSILNFAFGVDPQMIRDRTCFVAEHEERIVGVGGWSRRPSLCNIEDAQAFAAAIAADRATARLRGFFVHPEVARRGIGRTLLAICTTAAARAGFIRAELIASRTGRHLFRAAGFTPIEVVRAPFPNGVSVEGVRMERLLEPEIVASLGPAHRNWYAARVN
jgi:GNAT superfamily N-acetyltransferase